MTLLEVLRAAPPAARSSITNGQTANSRSTAAGAQMSQPSRHGCTFAPWLTDDPLIDSAIRASGGLLALKGTRP